MKIAPYFLKAKNAELLLRINKKQKTVGMERISRAPGNDIL